VYDRVGAHYFFSKISQYPYAIYLFMTGKEGRGDHDLRLFFKDLSVHLIKVFLAFDFFLAFWRGI